MKSQSSRAEDTAALLLHQRNDLPVLIPGAFERRASVAARPPGTEMPQTNPAAGAAVSVRERLVYELEGGGAPSQRSAGRPATLLQKLWRSLRSRPQVLKAAKATTLESVKYPAGETYALGFRAVQDKAPSASGIYGIFTSRRWLYVGKSHDVRQSLFQCLNDPDPVWSAERRPISFSFETTPTLALAT